MIKIHISITKQQNDELKREQKRIGYPISEIIRKAIDDYINKRNAEIVTRAQAERELSRDY